MIGKEVAEILGLPLRHVRRILAVHTKELAPALAHGNQGRKPYNAPEGNLRRQVTGLAHSTHTACKAQHLGEFLTERYKALKSRYKGSFCQGFTGHTCLSVSARALVASLLINRFSPISQCRRNCLSIPMRKIIQADLFTAISIHSGFKIRITN
jgi:hypothetical protein